MYLEENRNHYTSNWSESNCIGQREMREWLHSLWAVKPGLRKQIWKGACIALDAGKWLDCVTSICAAHSLPLPLESEKLPVGTGSNPVYLIGGYVIKLYVEGGLKSALHSLGSELEFYCLLHESGSPLIDYVPLVLASGILCYKDGCYESILWNGKGVPLMNAKCNLFGENNFPSDYSFSVWNKANVEISASGKSEPFADGNSSDADTSVWPYLITKRCKGEDFAHVREKLSKDDYFVLASFLGEQVRNLHSLPLPSMSCSRKQTFTDNSGKLDAAQAFNNQEEKNTPTNPHYFGLEDPFYTNCCIPPEWQLFIKLMRKRREDVKEHLKKWGNPIPDHLVDRVEEYLPHDPLVLLNICGVENGLLRIGKSCKWLHTDIMDDNIQMEPYLVDESLSGPGQMCGTTISLNPECSELEEFTDAKGNARRVMHPSYILDFSDLSIGDPIYELISIYLDVFRGNAVLLKHFLSSYKLPLLTRIGWTEQNMVGVSQADPDKLVRLSYHAMCYCLLHDDNVMGAIFSIWKELRKAGTWEEVEKTVWGFLNDYGQFC
eukprot:Gb_12446 [translate_table: standard]